MQSISSKSKFLKSIQTRFWWRRFEILVTCFVFLRLSSWFIAYARFHYYSQFLLSTKRALFMIKMRNDVIDNIIRKSIHLLISQILDSLRNLTIKLLRESSQIALLDAHLDIKLSSSIKMIMITSEYFYLQNARSSITTTRDHTQKIQNFLIDSFDLYSITRTFALQIFNEIHTMRNKMTQKTIFDLYQIYETIRNFEWLSSQRKESKIRRYEEMKNWLIAIDVIEINFRNESDSLSYESSRLTRFDVSMRELKQKLTILCVSNQSHNTIDEVSRNLVLLVVERLFLDAMLKVIENETKTNKFHDCYNKI